MMSPPSTLPDDPVELKKIIAQISARCDQYESRCKQYESENELLREQMRRLFDRLFGRKSEKLFGGSPQLLLFDMPEVDPEAETEAEEKIEVEPHARKKPGRKPLPENFPRVDVVSMTSTKRKRSAAVAQHLSVSARRYPRSSISSLPLSGSAGISDPNTAASGLKGLKTTVRP